MNNLWNEDISNALHAIQSGGVIVYPTDTIWGIGCDATCDEAVRRIFDIKKRQDSKSFLILVDSLDMLHQTVDNIPVKAFDLIDTYTEPLTIIYDSPRNVSPLLLAEDGSLGIRICKHEWCNALCKRLGKPLVSTSANISGLPSPTVFSDISEEIISRADYVAKYHREFSQINSPSRIIKLSTNGDVKTIR